MSFLKVISETLYFPVSLADADAVAATDVSDWVTEEGFTLLEIGASCDDDNPPTGSAAQFDVNKGGTTLLSTKVTIDAGEFHSDTAATAPVLATSPTVIAAGDRFEFDIDQVGSTNAGQNYVVFFRIYKPLVIS